MQDNRFPADVEDLLEKLSQLPQIRCAWIDFIFPNGYAEQCRIYKDNGIWMIEFLRERRGTVEQFFEGMSVYTAIQHGTKIVQARSKYGTIRELGPNVQGWYRDSEWPWIIEHFHTSEPDTES